MAENTFGPDENMKQAYDAISGEVQRARMNYQARTNVTAGTSGVNPESAHILKRADELIHYVRASDYGDAAEEWGKVAEIWSILLGTHVSARQAMLMMVMLKVCRENTVPKQDNLVDIAGYAALAGRL